MVAEEWDVAGEEKRWERPSCRGLGSGSGCGSE